MTKLGLQVFGAMATGGVMSLVLIFALQSGFDDLDASITKLEQSTHEMSESAESLLNSFDKFEEEITTLTQKMAMTSQVTDLCNQNYWQYGPCENITLSDGDVIVIEQDSISKHLIETFDAIQSGEKESGFKVPISPEDADQMMLYNSLG